MSKKNVIVLKHFEAPKKAGVYARLVCLSGESKGLAYYLNNSRIVMGRSDNVDIKVTDIKSSREHAEIVKNVNKFIITDLGSHNGIVVNDLKVKQHVLNDADKIIIGRTVYKFSIVKIDEAKVESKNLDSSKENTIKANVEKDKPKSKKKLIYILVALGLGFFMLESEEDVTVDPKRVKETQARNLKSVSMSLKRQKAKDKDKQKKMSIYFSRGLREFREGNYFRAMSEFESALSWSPNDPLALFYMRKTKDALNTAVENLFNKGRRDEDSIKYKNAAVSYCAVMRLLYRYPKDERYIDAEKKVRDIEIKLGLDEGELECIQKID